MGQVVLEPRLPLRVSGGLDKELPHTRKGRVAVTRFTLGYGKTLWRASRTLLRQGALACFSNPPAARWAGMLLEPCGERLTWNRPTAWRATTLA